ncbi:phytoene desaturase family protein [Pseudomonas cremoricolorata]|uniref:phytoene desaturase family protein n=1 Tax=Pseudomonas cremoricolorata TaxID=157783 RepID=UPI000424A099|nr:NAD(P)/FAD-dependent oxidoreductase [Pseudomonas cremoricolorata]
MSHEYDTVFVGAGLGALASASLMAQRGQKVLVVEKHNIPGGYASNFRRKDFTFDVSLHSFDGVMRGGHSFKVIEACGVADKVEFLHHPTLYRYRADDIDITVGHRDLEGYKNALFRFFPEETDNINRLFAESRRNYQDLCGFLYSRKPFWMRLVATPMVYPRVLRYGHETVDAYFSRFTANERLKEVLSAQWSYYGLPAKDLAFGYFSYPFIDYLDHGGYSIKGGSQALSQALVEVIEAHGGRVELESAVQRIVTSRGRIKGVVTRKSGEVRARNVVANISPQAVVALTGEEHFAPRYLSRLREQKLSVSGFQVYLGLDCPLSELGVGAEDYIHFFAPPKTQREQFEHIKAGELHPDNTSWSINYFSNIDPSMVPVGKSSLGLFTLTGPSEWHSLSKLEYRRKKQALTDLLIDNAERVMPGLRQHIEVCEAGSPRTMSKFTQNPEGAIYGFEQTTRQSGLFNRFPQKYPVKGLYQVGAWTFPGAGFIGTMLSARVLVDRYF